LLEVREQKRFRTAAKDHNYCRTNFSGFVYTTGPISSNLFSLVLDIFGINELVPNELGLDGQCLNVVVPVRFGSIGLGSIGLGSNGLRPYRLGLNGLKTNGFGLVGLGFHGYLLSIAV
jgi:hypothetical protein